MGNFNKVKFFTDSLYELFVEQKISLEKSLEIMAFEKKSKVQKACEEIKNELFSGNRFSNALIMCRKISFDKIYISFISFAEITGNLGKTLEFLKKRCERKDENKSKLIDVSIYPVFVICLTVGLCIFLFHFVKQSGIEIDTPKISFWGIFLMFLISFSSFLYIQKSLQENKLYESFLAIGFLNSSGIDIANAVGAGVIIMGPESKYGVLFQKVRRRLEYGMDLYGAFEDFEINEEIKNIFYFAKMAGSKADVFEKIAWKLGREDEKRKRRCLELVEPIFIGITGCFLILLIMSYFMPAMWNMSWSI